MKNKNCFKELQKTLLEQKYPKSLIEASILKAHELPLEILRQPQTAKKWVNYSFYNYKQSQKPNVFPIIKKTLIPFSILKQCPKFFRGTNLLNLWAKHLILVDYSVGLNLNPRGKITRWKIVERIALAALIL